MKSIGKIKKLIVTAVLAVGMVCSISGMALLGNAATESVTTENNFRMIETSARISADSNVGIRFSAVIDSVKEDSEYYVMIIPESYRKTYNLTADSDYYEVLRTTGGLKSEIDVENAAEINMLVMPSTPVLQTEGKYNGKYLINGSIGNIRYANSNSNFFGVAFEKTASGERVYATDQDNGIQNLCKIASTELNESGNDLLDDEKVALQNAVKAAYNVSIGNAEDKQEDIPAFKVQADDPRGNNVQSGSSYTPVIKGIPEGLDIDVSCGITSGATASVAEGDTILVNDEVKTIVCYAKILGEEYPFTITSTKPISESGIVEDFGSGNNSRNAIHKAVDADWTDKSAGYKAEVTDAKNVKASGAVLRLAGSSQQGISFRSALAKDDLKGVLAQADTISARVLFGAAQDRYQGKAYTSGGTDSTLTVKFMSGVFTLPINTWVDVTISKTDLVRRFNGKTLDEKLDAFCSAAANNGVGVSNFIICESYPEYTYVDKNGAEKKSKEFDVVIDMLFTNKAVIDNLDGATPITYTKYKNNSGELLFEVYDQSSIIDSYTDTASITKNNVLKIDIDKHKWIKIRFDKTAEELSKITSISFDFMYESVSDNVLRYSDNRVKDASGNVIFGQNTIVQAVATRGKWVTVTWTKEQLCKKFITQDQQDVDTAWAMFCNNFALDADITSDNAKFFYLMLGEANLYIANFKINVG